MKITNLTILVVMILFGSALSEGIDPLVGPIEDVVTKFVALGEGVLDGSTFAGGPGRTGARCFVRLACDNFRFNGISFYNHASIGISSIATFKSILLFVT